MQSKFLVIDDDLAISNKFKSILGELDIMADYYSCYEDVIPALKKSPYQYAGIFLDHNLKNKKGESVESLDLVPQIKKLNPDLVLVMISGDKSEKNLKRWLDLDVDKFLYKPIEGHLIKALCDYATSKYSKEFQVSNDDEIKLTEREKERISKVGIVSESKTMARVCLDILKFSKSDAPVLLMGETGTGKELLAKAIHNNSDRSQGTFLVLNCSSYSSNSDLLESELLGHVKGAFTGADRDKAGIFEKAHNGTVFLDEIHHLSPQAQAKLLRVIQEKKVRQVGAFREKEVNFRLICAAKPEMMEKVQSHEFLPDLYYRISFLDINIPPLRDRTEDINPLLEYFSSLNKIKYSKNKKFANSVINVFKSYLWPGNVRELESIIESIYVKADQYMITTNDLDKRFNQVSSKAEENLAIEFDELINKQKEEQKHFILRTLKYTNFNISKTAEKLNMARTTLNSKMKTLGIDRFSKVQLEHLYQKVCQI